MDHFGFIHEKMDIKILILYVLEQLPGPVDAPGSAAPLRLLREGAGICTCAQDILVDMGWAQKTETAIQQQMALPALEGRTEVQKQIVLLMQDEPKRFEELAAESGISPDVLTGELTLLELDGIVEPRAGRIYALRT